MNRRTFSSPLLSAVTALAVFVSCGGDSGTTPTVNPTPVATPTPAPTPTPTPATIASPSPAAATKCPPSGEPGPVARYAISPRAQVTDDRQVDMMVRARPNWDEVWCIDRNKEHRLDFNSNQRNAAGRECCWEGEPQWQVVQDSNDMVVSGNTIAGSNSFNYRLRLSPRGRSGVVLLQATLDGKSSYPWQSNSGYSQGPLAIVAMSAEDITRECKCIFRGNGIYEGVGCTK
jgi:hypothetical protein